MKFGTRLVLSYLAPTVMLMVIIGFIVLQVVEMSVMSSVERQLINQSKFAEAYISQDILLKSYAEEELDADNAKDIVYNLSNLIGQVSIYDTELKLLSSSIDEDDRFYTILKDSLFEPALNSHYSYTISGNKIIFASSIDIRRTTHGVLVMLYDLSFLNDIMQQITRIFLAAAVIFCVLITILSIYIAKRAVNPIEELVKAASRYAVRDFVPVRTKRSDEIGKLSESFNEMGARLQDYIQRQKQFVSNVSHELRTPLTAIKGYSELLDEEIGEGHPLKKAVYHLNNEARRLTKMVNELLFLSRMDAGREKYEFQNLNLSRLVSQTVHMLEIKASKYQVEFKVSVEYDRFVSGDGEKLTQALVNIIDNSIKYSSAGSTVDICLYSKERTVVLEVSDQGIGIPEDEINKVFDRFYRASNSEGIIGTGLGLAITREIVEMHNGRVRLCQKEGGGIKVVVELPWI